MTPELKKKFIEQAFEKLFSKSHFDITILDQIGEILKVNPARHENYKYLRALHCVDFNKMDHDIKRNIQPMVLSCFRDDYFIPASAMATALLIEGNVIDGVEDFTHFKRLN